jgi:hypothetical protein
VVAVDLEHRELDVGTDDDGLAGFACQDQHRYTPAGVALSAGISGVRTDHPW